MNGYEREIAKDNNYICNYQEAKEYFIINYAKGLPKRVKKNRLEEMKIIQSMIDESFKVNNILLPNKKINMSLYLAVVALTLIVTILFVKTIILSIAHPLYFCGLGLSGVVLGMAIFMAENEYKDIKKINQRHLFIKNKLNIFNKNLTYNTILDKTKEESNNKINLLKRKIHRLKQLLMNTQLQQNKELMDSNNDVINLPKNEQITEEKGIIYTYRPRKKDKNRFHI